MYSSSNRLERDAKITDVPDDVLKIIYRYGPEMLPTLGLTSKEIAKVSNKVLCEQPVTRKEIEVFLLRGYTNFAIIDNLLLSITGMYFTNTLSGSYYEIYIHSYDSVIYDRVEDILPENKRGNARNIGTELEDVHNAVTNIFTEVNYAMDHESELDLLSTYRILKERRICESSNRLQECNSNDIPARLEYHSRAELPYVLGNLEDRSRSNQNYALDTVLKKLTQNYIKYQSKILIDITNLPDEDIPNIEVGDVHNIIAFYTYIYFNCRIFNLPNLGSYQEVDINILKNEQGDIILPNWDNNTQKIITAEKESEKIIKLIKFIEKFYPILYTALADLE